MARGAASTCFHRLSEPPSPHLTWGKAGFSQMRGGCGPPLLRKCPSVAREGRTLPETPREVETGPAWAWKLQARFQEPACSRSLPSLSPGPGCHAAVAGWAALGAAGPREAALWPLLFTGKKQTQAAVTQPLHA